jgi:NAD(P)-dependent dehydrogenase (short-subunit alcohol dehydrogenase family)
MSQKLAGKVAVVMGASKGIGAAIAQKVAAEGAAVVVNYSSSKEAAQGVVAEIARKGGKAVAPPEAASSTSVRWPPLRLRLLSRSTVQPGPLSMP